MSACGVFALTLLGCVVVPIFAGMALSVVIPPAFLLIYIPAFVVWDGTLMVGSGASDRMVTEGDWVHAIPVAVWVLTAAGFAWAARGLGRYRQVGASVGVVVLVTVGMQLILAILGIRLQVRVL